MRRSARSVGSGIEFWRIGSETGAILLALGLGGLVVGATGWYFWASRSEPAQPEFATVIGFANLGSAYGVSPHVVVQMKDGSEKQLRVGTQHTLIHCRRGSVIRLVRREDALFVDPRGCGQVHTEVTGVAIPRQ